MSPLVFIAFSTVFGICGQLALKHGMSRIGGASGTRLLVRIATSPWVVGGLFVYGCGVIFWLLALSRLEVSYVYPFASLSYIGIIIGSYLLFKERINRMRLIGIIIVIVGVIVSSLSINL
ncbi:MAG: EamA family transporter [Anaerolineae bacterium]|nr:EamA family transporter [Anaerolineae bacterium]